MLCSFLPSEVLIRQQRAPCKVNFRAIFVWKRVIEAWAQCFSLAKKKTPPFCGLLCTLKHRVKVNLLLLLFLFFPLGKQHKDAFPLTSFGSKMKIGVSIKSQCTMTVKSCSYKAHLPPHVKFKTSFSRCGKKASFSTLKRNSICHESIFLQLLRLNWVLWGWAILRNNVDPGTSPKICRPNFCLYVSNCMSTQLIQWCRENV